MPHISNWFFRLAVCYLVLGISFGLYMAGSNDHSMIPVHAHLNLLGWASMSIFAIFYRLWPAAAASKLAKVHFWAFVPANVVQLVTLFLLLRGMASIEPVLAIASMVVGVAVLVFAVNVWKHTGSAATVTQPVGTAAAG